MYRKSLAFVAVAGLLTACGLFGGGAPGKAEIQSAIDRLAKETPILFGSDKPEVKKAKCSKAGKDTFSCTLTIASANEPKPRALSVQLIKQGKEWHAQML